MDADDANIFADGMNTNRTLTSLNISANNIGQSIAPDGQQLEKGILTGSKPEGVLAIQNAITNMTAMVTVNVIGNKIGKEPLSKLQEMMQAHPTLVSLCGIANDATEANFSDLGMDADDVTILAGELFAKTTLKSLEINNITEQQLSALTNICETKHIQLYVNTK